MTANRPGSMSMGGTPIEPPSSWHRATVASVSATAKYTSQWAGTSGGTAAGIGSMPATLRPSSRSST
jgi:3D (Asp-Asp-Asp) domain-containing protein